MPDIATPGRRQLAMERLGREIRQAREAAGLSQKALGDALHCTQGKINKLEDGSNRVKLPELEKIVEVCGIGEEQTRQLRGMAIEIESLPNTINQLSVPSWFQRFAVLEPAASEVFSWHTERLPGLLQTEHYMHKQFSAAGVSGGELARHWRARRSRKEIFDLEQPPRYRFVLGESCLYRTPDGFSPFVVWDEAQYLMQLAERYPHVTIQVLPFSARIPFAHTDFTVMRFQPDKRDFVYIEHPAGGSDFKSEQDIHQFHTAWDSLAEAALDPAASADFLRQVQVTFREMAVAEAAGDYQRPAGPFVAQSIAATIRDQP